VIIKQALTELVAVADPGLANGGPRSSAAQKFFWGGAMTLSRKMY